MVQEKAPPPSYRSWAPQSRTHVKIRHCSFIMHVRNLLLAAAAAAAAAVAAASVFCFFVFFKFFIAPVAALFLTLILRLDCPQFLVN